jgi:uncharacterized protein YpmB
MYLVNFKLVASGVDSLVAMDMVDISTCALIKVAAATVVMHLQGLDGSGGLANDTVTITMQGTTAEKQANAILVGKELAKMVNRAKHVGISQSNKLEEVGNKFMNTTGTVGGNTVTGIVTLTTVVAA